MQSNTRVSSGPVPVGAGHSSGIRRPCRVKVGQKAWCAALCTAVMCAGLFGCGTDLDAVVAQTGNAAATTFLDLLLTDVANQVADSFDQNRPRPPGDGEADGENGDQEDGGGDGDDAASIFAANCASCHGTDGASGFAPDITGLTVEDMAAGLESGTHASIALTDEEIAAVTEFLGG